MANNQYPDLGITQKQDGEYWDIVIPQLDLSTNYGVQFAWVYKDKDLGTSDFSDVFEFTTPGPNRPEVTNIVWVWDGTTLKGTWDNASANAKTYQIYLNPVGGTSDSERSWTKSADQTQTKQIFTLTKDANIGNFNRIFRTQFTGKIKTTYLDGTTSGVSFTTPAYSDPVCTATISDSSWSVLSIANGLSVSWQDETTKAETYKYTNVYVSTSQSGPWTQYSGTSPVQIPLYDFATRYVKLNHFSSSECESSASSIKEGKAYDPITFDDTPPTNDFVLGTTTVTDDSNGLFSFDKKVLFTWTQNSDTGTAGYRIRFRIAGTSDPYTFMSVPGRDKTSTYLYGLKGGKTYEIAVSTFDIYGNTNETDWKTYPNVVAPVSTSLLPDVAITAGDMKLGYGIGGSNSQKGLYIAPDNYWYVQGNTNVSSAARLSVGGTTDKLIWDGSNLTVTGTVNANAGKFTGSIDIGTPTVDGQLRITVSGPTGGKIEMGKLTSVLGSTVGAGIQVTNTSNGIYAQLDPINGIIAKKGSIGGWNIGSNTLSAYANKVGMNAPDVPTDSDVAFWAGGLISDPKFKVTYGGLLQAINAKIYGEVRSNTAKFGTFDDSNFTNLTKGWEVDGAQIKSTKKTAGSAKVYLDGEWGAVSGANLIGSVLWLSSLTAQQADAETPEASATYGNDYISSAGHFRLGNGKIRYSSGTGLIVSADLSATNLYITNTQGDTSSVDFIKSDGTFSLGNGTMKYSNGLFTLGENSTSWNNFKIRLAVYSNYDGTAGDTTIVRDKDGYLTTGRAFYYGGGSLPNGATQRSISQFSVPFSPGDIWMSRV